MNINKIFFIKQRRIEGASNKTNLLWCLLSCDQVPILLSSCLNQKKFSIQQQDLIGCHSGAQLPSPGELVLSLAALCSHLSFHFPLLSACSWGKAHGRGDSPLKQIEDHIGLLNLSSMCLHSCPLQMALKATNGFASSDYTPQQLGISVRFGTPTKDRTVTTSSLSSREQKYDFKGKIAIYMFLRTWHLPALLCFVRNTNHPNQIFMGHSNKK